MKLKTFKSWHFEASEDIKTKFKSQALHIIKIKYWNAGRSGNPPFLIHVLWNIGILIHKQATLGKHFEPECMLESYIIYFLFSTHELKNLEGPTTNNDHADAQIIKTCF